MRPGDRVQVLNGGPTDVGLLDLRGQHGVVKSVGRRNASVLLDGLDHARPIPLAILGQEDDDETS